MKSILSVSAPRPLPPVLPQELIDEALADSGVKDGLRRKLPVRLTAWLVILLCLFRDRSYVNLIRMVATATAWRGLWRRGTPPTSSALSRARDRVGVSAMRLHLRAQRLEVDRGVGGATVSTGCDSLPSTGPAPRFPTPPKTKPGSAAPRASRGRSGYPQLRLVGLMDVGTRMQRAVRFGPYLTGEMTLARALLPQIPAGLLVLLDRNFMAYDLLWDILQRGSHFLVRVKSNAKVRVIRTLGPGDALVEIDVPRHWRRDRPDLPRTLTPA